MKNIKTEIITLKNNCCLEKMYHEMGIPQFFSCIDSAALANLVSLAIKTTALFGITYVCESFFSKLNLNKMILDQQFLKKISKKL